MCSSKTSALLVLLALVLSILAGCAGSQKIYNKGLPVLVVDEATNPKTPVVRLGLPNGSLTAPWRFVTGPTPKGYEGCIGYIPPTPGEDVAGVESALVCPNIVRMGIKGKRFSTLYETRANDTQWCNASGCYGYMYALTDNPFARRDLGK